MNLPRVLIVEDERALGLALAATVRKAGASGEIAPTAALARRLLEAEKFSAMVLDIGLPDKNGLVFLAELPEELRLPTLVITAHGEIENTITARKLEVGDFLTKPLDFSEFTEALKRILPTGSRSSGAGKKGGPSGPFIGAAPAMRPVFQHIAHACATTDPVLISGETGTGKSAAAMLIFRNGERSDGPLEFVRPGAGGQAEALGAAWDRASGGGLILEDIDQLDPDAQVELVRRWDAEADELPRILATSGPDLHAAVGTGRIRSDLYYRLQVLEVRLPPLRDRAEDIPALLDFFLGELAPGRSISVDAQALGVLRDYDWPGNLRELRNVASYALTVGGGTGVLDRSHLPEHVTGSDRRSGGGEVSDFEKRLSAWVGAKLEGLGEGALPPYREIADELEGMLIADLLDRFDGKLAPMAKAMQANRTTLRKKMRG